MAGLQVMRSPVAGSFLAVDIYGGAGATAQPMHLNRKTTISAHYERHKAAVAARLLS